MPKRIAIWNTTRGIWEHPEGAVDLLSAHSEPFSETWPTSGTTRTGSAYARPTPELRTAASASSSSRGLLPTPHGTTDTGPGEHGSGGPNLQTVIDQLLPTPVTTDAESARRSTTSTGRMHSGTSLGDALLPTPTSGEWVRSPEQVQERRARRPNGADLIEAVIELQGPLLPTPTVNDMGDGKTLQWWEDWTEAMREKHGNGNGHGASLAIEALRLQGSAPTPPPSSGGST